jgi:hypothetical protein
MPKPTDHSASSHWLGKLATLYTARTERRCIAPYKPLFLFCVLDMIEGGLKDKSPGETFLTSDKFLVNLAWTVEPSPFQN